MDISRKILKISAWNFVYFLMNIWWTLPANFIKFWDGRAGKFQKICWIVTEWPNGCTSACLGDCCDYGRRRHHRHYHHTVRVVLFSVESVCFSNVCLWLCLCVNTITPELLEISSQNIHGMILWLKGRTSSKKAIQDTGVRRWWYNVSDFWC